VVAWLDELPPADGYADYTGVFQAGGQDVAHGVGFRTLGFLQSQVGYNIGGHYSQLQVSLAIGDAYQAAAHLDIFGDGKSLLSGGVDVYPNPNSPLINKTVNVAGVQHLVLFATTSSTVAQAMFGNAKLTA
jgi:hypothetical protein